MSVKSTRLAILSPANRHDSGGGSRIGSRPPTNEEIARRRLYDAASAGELDELDDVAVGVLDEGGPGVVLAWRLRFLDDRAAGGLDDPITRYVPELLERDTAFSAITLRHLVTMSSGLAWSESKTPWGDPADTYYSTDLRGTAKNAEIAEPPGRRFVYNNYNPLLVGEAIERAVDTTLSAFLSDAIWAPMGAEADGSWSLDRADGGFEKMESGFNARARDLARFGRLFLRGGRLGSRQILSRSWVEASVAADSGSDPSLGYQYFWWIAPQPDGAPHFWAEGRFGQFVYVVPDLDLVVVRLGRHDGDLNWRSFMAAVAKRVASDVAAGDGGAGPSR